MLWVVGLKPTYGRVSRYGLIAYASSLDQIGPMTKDVTDAALLLNIISGHDKIQPRLMSLSEILRQQMEVSRLRIGLAKRHFQII